MRDIQKDKNKEGGKQGRKTNEKLEDRNGKIENKRNTRTEIKTLKSLALWLGVVWQDFTDVTEK